MNPDLQPETVESLNPQQIFLEKGTVVSIVRTPGDLLLILLRHAEKERTLYGAELSEQGKKRAVRLAKILQDCPLDRIYATSMARAIQTAMPLAESRGMEVLSYEPIRQTGILERFLQEPGSKQMLMVGHMNTVPALLNAISHAARYRDIPEDQFDDLFLIHLQAGSSARIIHLKY